MLTGSPTARGNVSIGENEARRAAADVRPARFGEALTGHVGRVVLWAVPVVVVVIMAAAKRWTFDDGFIYFRTVDQILAGNGPVFNDGERVESFTSPLWLAVLTAGEIVSPLRLEYTAAVLSIACAAIGMGMATVGSARLARSEARGETRILIPFGSIVFAALWPVWIWSTSGLEVGMTYAWIGTCLWVLARWATSSGPCRPAVPGLVVLGMGWLVRPELALSSVVFVGVVVALSGQCRGERLRTVAFAAALPVSYQIFRMGYYGLLVSSPAIAKEGAAANPQVGWSYLKDFLAPYLLAVPLLAIVVGVAVPLVRRLLSAGLGRSAAVVISVAASGLLHAGTVVMIGGDYVHARLLLPALFAFLAPFFVVAASRRSLHVLLAVGCWAVFALLVLRPPEGARGFVMGSGYLGTFLTYEDHGFAQRGPDQPWIDGPGLYIAHWVGGGGDPTQIELIDRDDTVVASYPLGAVGYVLGPDVRVVDLWGLADPITGHRRLTFRGIPGHEKSASGPWLVARLARDPSRVLPIELDFNGQFDPRPVGLDYLEQVAWAEAALRCPSIERLTGSYDSPLTPSRFLRNLWASFANTRMRIAYFPDEAYEQDCAAPSLPPTVVDYFERPTVVSSLPVGMDRGALVVVGDCAAVYVATGDRDDPWVPVDASTFGATVDFDPADTTPRLAAVWVLRPYGEATAVVWVETDGSGRYRFRRDIDWFPPTLQEWTPIPADGVVQALLTPDLANRDWLLVTGSATVGATPMMSENERLTAIVPEVPGPSATAGTIRIDHTNPETSASCSRFLEAE